MAKICPCCIREEIRETEPESPTPQFENLSRQAATPDEGAEVLLVEGSSRMEVDDGEV